MLTDLGALVRRSIRIATPMARAQVEGTMNAQLQVLRPTEPVFNRNTGAFDPVEDIPRYEGKGRISLLTGPQQLALGEEQQFFSTGTVTIPLAAKRPQVDDMVKVLEHPDPNMINRLFRVIDVQAGGEMPTGYHLTVSGAQPGKTWGDQAL